MKGADWLAARTPSIGRFVGRVGPVKGTTCGKASFDGAKLKIADVFSTMMACEQSKMEREAAFLAVVAKTASYTVEVAR